MKIALFVGASLLLSSQLLAQYVGQGSTGSYKSIKDVLDNPIDDAKVVLDGYLIKQINNDKYIFSDNVSEIIVEIDKDKFFSDIDEKTKIRISGEVEKDFAQDVEIDVDFIEIIK